ncbi:MAG: M12 family metallo-peptidase [Kangiellaceae bacterium]|nr:M12 family metallo-peptidase [Kangiellaceae bacterium]MCW9018639.1 M12 family metallo-peptidase [Kangiellaceae bacterium]
MKKTLVAAMLGVMSLSVKAETIDIMMLYTGPAAQKTGNIETKINNYISYANRVYQNNYIDVTLRNVAWGKITDSDLQPTSADLGSITNSSSIQGYRNTYKADMVALIGTREEVVQNGQLYYTCGIAYLGWVGNYGTSWSNDHAYSISAVDCGESTFVHELGHNMGLAHSRAQGDTTGGAFTYGMGHGVNNSFATIMAYPHVFGSQTTHLDYFSDSDWYQCLGQACGQTNVSEAYHALSNPFSGGKSVVELIAGYR